MVYAIDLRTDTANPLRHISTIGSIVNTILPILFIGAGLSFLGMIVLAGFIYLGSEGNPEKLKKAQQLIMSAVIGLAVVLMSYLLVKLIGSTLGYTFPI